MTANTAIVQKEETPAPVVHTPMAMIERAIANGAGIETIERLMALHERYEAAQAKRAFDEALGKAQEEMRPVAANADNAQTKSRYATYAALDGALRPIYTRYGFSLSFDTGEGAPSEYVRIICRVALGGHREIYHIDMPADGKGAKVGDVMTKTHATGSAATYGRRYLLGMIFNIPTLGKDDDGNAADGNPDLALDITADQFRELKDLLEESGSKEADMLTYVKATSVEAMTLGQYAKAKAAMVDKIALKKQKGGK